MPRIVKDYRTWNDYRNALGEMDPAGYQSNDSHWCGTSNIGEALAIADRGWPEGMEYVQRITIPIVNAMASTDVQEGGWEYDVTGANYDVGAYLSGVPECWLAPTAVASRPCITIAANIVSSGGIDAKHVSTRGAAVAALAFALQSSGFAVRIYAIQGMAINSAGSTVWLRVNLTDDSGGPLDIDRILFGMAHISNTRQLGYSLGCHLTGNRYSSGILWPENNSKALPPAEWTSDIYLPASHLDDVDWDDSAAVSKWVADTYATLSGQKE